MAIEPAAHGQPTELRHQETQPADPFDGQVRSFRGWILDTEDWVWLNPGYRVRVQRGNDGVELGLVDIIAPDASIFWVWLDGGRGRIAVHQEDTVVVWLEGDRSGEE